LSLRAAAFDSSSSTSSCADPMCSMSREPRREEFHDLGLGRIGPFHHARVRSYD
jgi:hypothetical protein